MFVYYYRALDEIAKLGGNPYLEEIVHKLSLVYKQKAQSVES